MLHSVCPEIGGHEYINVLFLESYVVIDEAKPTNKLG